MKDVAILVQGVSKSYRQGHQPSYHRFSELIENIGRNLTRLPKFLTRRGGASASSKPPFFWALDDVSFEVHKGEVLGIIGRNGAGKSTLLKLLSRITYPTRGRIEIQGRVSSLLEVGTGFHPELTGRENVYLNGAVLGMSRTEISRKFDEIVAFSEVERFLDTPVKHYSSGMYVRLAFSVAAHLEPEILIVDEVLAVGDASFQQKCLAKMGSASRQGKTVLIVSHNLSLMSNLCHRAILLNGGRVEATGLAGDVVQQYMANSRSASGEVAWATPDGAPGNETARLHAVRILQEGVEGPTAEVDIGKSISIQISYWNLIPGQRLYPAIWLKHLNGTFVLSTSNLKAISSTDDPWYGKPLPVGLYTATCVLPGEFLNDGRYVISAIIGRVPNRLVILEESVLTFDVCDTNPTREQTFGALTAPVIRPHLTWKTIQLTSGFQ